MLCRISGFQRTGKHIARPRPVLRPPKSLTPKPCKRCCAQVGALRELRKDMGVRRSVLLKVLTEEAERRLYYGTVGGEESPEEDAPEDDIPELQARLGTEALGCEGSLG